MKVLVATAQGQGARYSDFHYCVEGELVWLPPPCDHGENDPGELCGCGRSFRGLSSHRATTTARVADLDISAEDYLTALPALDAEAIEDLIDAADDAAIYGGGYQRGDPDDGLDDPHVAWPRGYRWPDLGGKA